MPTGRVVNWRQSQGYGFITPEGEGPDAFLHFTEFDGPPHKIRNGLRVSYEEAPGQNEKPKAVNVQVIRGRPAQAFSADEGVADLLSSSELSKELTTIFQEATQRVIALARQHGWVE